MLEYVTTQRLVRRVTKLRDGTVRTKAVAFSVAPEDATVLVEAENLLDIVRTLAEAKPDGWRAASYDKGFRERMRTIISRIGESRKRLGEDE